MKKTFGLIAIVLALTVLSSGIFAGCNANHSASAASACNNTAKRIERTVDRLEVMNDKDFKFPAVFGNEFCFDGECVAVRDPRIVPLPARIDDCPPGVDCKPTHRRKSKGYSNFITRFDELYALCASISMTNNKCIEKMNAIREEAIQLRNLSAELKRTKMTNKEAFEKLNSYNKELNESTKNLDRDRNRLRTYRRLHRHHEHSVNVETDTARNLKLRDKVENRLKLLEDTHGKIAKLNDEMRVVMVKPSGKLAEHTYTPRYRTLPHRGTA
jgi:hypothetical protein